MKRYLAFLPLVSCFLLVAPLLWAGMSSPGLGQEKKAEVKTIPLESVYSGNGQKGLKWVSLGGGLTNPIRKSDGKDRIIVRPDGEKINLGPKRETPAPSVFLV